MRRGEDPKRRLVINNAEVIPLYGVPHLFKGIRNNMLKKDLIRDSSDRIREAKWKDIETAYHIDCGSGNVRAIPKITEFHVVPSKIRKMKVSCATQVFSHSMAAAIAVMARNSK